MNDRRPSKDVSSWDHPLDPIAITLAEIMDGRSDVLLVVHEAGHGGWQLLDGRDTSGRAPLVVPKEALLVLDATIREVTDLPAGWTARRVARGSPWTRMETPEELRG
jgi:hypothetical protein